MECTRKIEDNKLFVGQSFSLFPRNKKSDVATIIDTFGWSPDELIGNETTAEVLERAIDLKSQKCNLDKIFKGQKVNAEAKERLDKL